MTMTSCSVLACLSVVAVLVNLSQCATDQGIDTVKLRGLIEGLKHNLAVVHYRPGSGGSGSNGGGGGSENEWRVAGSGHTAVSRPSWTRSLRNEVGARKRKGNSQPSSASLSSSIHTSKLEHRSPKDPDEMNIYPLQKLVPFWVIKRNVLGEEEQMKTVKRTGQETLAQKAIPGQNQEQDDRRARLRWFVTRNLLLGRAENSAKFREPKPAPEPRHDRPSFWLLQPYESEPRRTYNDVYSMPKSKGSSAGEDVVSAGVNDILPPKSDE